jgi:hypothetical protein
VFVDLGQRHKAWITCTQGVQCDQDRDEAYARLGFDPEVLRQIEELNAEIDIVVRCD